MHGFDWSTNLILLKIDMMFVIRWCMPEIIDLTKNSISNCNLRQHAFFCKYICAHCFDWSTYIMSIIVSNWQHCDEQQFRTLSCVHYTIFSVVKSDLFIRALLLDRILVTEKTTRTPRVHLVIFIIKKITSPVVIYVDINMLFLLCIIVRRRQIATRGTGHAGR